MPRAGASVQEKGFGTDGRVFRNGVAVETPRGRFFASAFPSRESSVNWVHRCAVGVAQLVERRSVAPNVAGSIPVSHPNFQKTYCCVVRKSHAFLRACVSLPSNRSRISSGKGALKSSGTTNFPRYIPKKLARLLPGTEIRRATGTPRFVIVISSPVATRSRRRENCALASLMLTNFLLLYWTKLFR